jgi:hypothetical protein
MLQWEPFPRRVDLSAERNGVQNVTYELRIWRAESPIAGPCAPFPSFAPDSFGKGPCVFPGDVAYARTGLVTPVHTVDSPLAPDTVYLWSVRAHFGAGWPAACHAMECSERHVRKPPAAGAAGRNAAEFATIPSNPQNSPRPKARPHERLGPTIGAAGGARRDGRTRRLSPD